MLFFCPGPGSLWEGGFQLPVQSFQFFPLLLGGPDRTDTVAPGDTGCRGKLHSCKQVQTHTHRTAALVDTDQYINTYVDENVTLNVCTMMFGWILDWCLTFLSAPGENRIYVSLNLIYWWSGFLVYCGNLDLVRKREAKAPGLQEPKEVQGLCPLPATTGK